MRLFYIIFTLPELFQFALVLYTNIFKETGNEALVQLLIIVQGVLPGIFLFMLAARMIIIEANKLPINFHMKRLC